MSQCFPVALMLASFLLLVPPVELRWKEPKRDPTDRSAFDYYVFAVNNKEGFCNTSAKCNSRFVSAEPWTIHGLWPSNASRRSSPTSCLVPEKFSTEKLAPIQEQLKQHWPSYVGSYSKFWQHEWAKHGSCAVNHTLISSVFDYFNRTLELHRKLNVTSFLANDNIVGSEDPFKTHNFTEALENDLGGHRVQVMCRRAGSISVVVEVRICLNETDLSVIDCPKKQPNCRKKLYYIPPDTESGPMPLLDNPTLNATNLDQTPTKTASKFRKLLTNLERFYRPATATSNSPMTEINTRQSNRTGRQLAW